MDVDGLFLNHQATKPPSGVENQNLVSPRLGGWENPASSAATKSAPDGTTLTPPPRFTNLPHGQESRHGINRQDAKAQRKT
jgi:hypothetical protein